MSTKKGFGIGCLTIAVIAFVLSIFFMEYAASVLALTIFIFPVAALVHYFMRDGDFFEKHGGNFWAGIIVVTMLLAIPLSRSLDVPSTDDPENSELVDSQSKTDAAAVYDGNGIPKLLGPICDYAGIFSEKEAAELEKRLLAFENAEIPAQFVVLTLKKLPSGKTESAYAQEIGDAWRLGKEGVDNGLLLLFALEDRAVFLATGYGLEGDLPDGKCGSLCRLAIPSFKNGKYANGIAQIVDGVDQVLNHNRYFANAVTMLEEELKDFPGAERFHDNSEHFTPEHRARLTELLEQASENSNYNLHFLHLPQMHGLTTDEIADKAWERLKASDPQAALLFYSLDGKVRASAIRTPEDVMLPNSFQYSLKYSRDHEKEKQQYESSARVILEFEEAFTGKHPKGWWSFNLLYGILVIIFWIVGIGGIAFILYIAGFIIWSIIDERRHPEKAAARRASSSSSHSSYSSYSSHSHYSGGGSSGGSHFGGGGGRFGGGGGGARW
ncbi:MAG: TPM domain-containing protein [Lentisphaeria bacterium]|nr:TPM domain-containing protein [Lentisphaeria bacterium]